MEVKKEYSRFSVETSNEEVKVYYESNDNYFVVRMCNNSCLVINFDCIDEIIKGLQLIKEHRFTSIINGEANAC